MDGKLVIIFIIVNCMATCSGEAYCPPRCLRCKARDFCTTCKPEFWDNRQFHVCNKDCPTTCATNECDDRTGICKECPEGFYGARCQISCDICTDYLCDVKKCTNGCIEGLYEVQDYRGVRQCKECTMGCSRCSTFHTCDKCKPGYYKAGYSCAKCPTGCKQCINMSTCSECEDGRFGTTCEHVCTMPHCQNCDSSSGQCLRCQSGFILEYGECIDCSKACMGSCASNGVCQGKCEDGYGGARCNKTCPPYCKTCKKFKTAVCTKCHDHFYGARCNLPCSESCLVEAERRSCMLSNGTCPTGCVYGRYGARCTGVCPASCLHGYCSQMKGKLVCDHGCKKGFSGDRCSVRVKTTTARSVTYTDEDNLDYYTTDLYVIYPELPADPTQHGTYNLPEQDSDTTPIKNDDSKQSIASDHNVYVYIGLGVGLCVTLLVIALLAGYIAKRRNPNSQKTPNVIYIHGSNTIENPDRRMSHDQTHGDYVEPNTSHVYDYVQDDHHLKSTPNTATGYLQPSTMADRQTNPYQTYLTPVHVTEPSIDEQPSSYEPLKFTEATNNEYAGLRQQPDSTYQTVF